MNTLQIKGLVALAAVMLLLAAGTRVAAQGFLHTRGTDIVDANGNKIVLRGVGLGNWMLPEGYMWKFGENGDRPRKIEKIVEDCIGKEKAALFWKTFQENYITEADIKRIAELGYNSVRPALNSRLFITEGDQNVFVDEGFTLLDNLVKWCKKYHLYVIIDMHGAPGGQTGQNIDDSPNNEPELFMYPKNQDLLEILWLKIAERYKDEPTVAAYDLLNEPLPENTGAAEKYKHLLMPLYKRLISTIRSVDQNHMFTIEGYNWSNNWSLFDTPPDNNLIYQFHYYCWSQPDNLNDISYYLKQQKHQNVPVWVGETGEKNNAIYFATTQYFEKNNIGWSFWPWKKMETANTPYSINKPKGWDAIAEYSRGGPKPGAAVDAEAIFNELLDNVKLENCVYFPDVVNAMFRRLPLKIEAENYGHNGYLHSYYVNDTTARASTYRTQEPLPVSTFGRENEQQCIELSTGEWTAYDVAAIAKSTYSVTLRVKALQPSVLAVTVNGKTQTFKVKSAEWNHLSTRSLKFPQGKNTLKVLVMKGKVQLDWLDVR